MVLVFSTAAGRRIMVGESPAENDQLVQSASPDDTWFHLSTKEHGSPHAILAVARHGSLSAGVEVSRDDEAAAIADAAQVVKFCSKASTRDAAKTRVCYLPVANVENHADGNLGMVRLLAPPQLLTVCNDQDAISRLRATQTGSPSNDTRIEPRIEPRRSNSEHKAAAHRGAREVLDNSASLELDLLDVDAAGALEMHEILPELWPELDATYFGSPLIALGECP
jgi:hypothetical protein